MGGSADAHVCVQGAGTEDSERCLSSPALELRHRYGAVSLRSIDLCRELCTFLCRFDPCGLGPTEQRLYPEGDITH